MFYSTGIGLVVEELYRQFLLTETGVAKKVAQGNQWCARGVRRVPLLGKLASIEAIGIDGIDASVFSPAPARP
jgi:hypothetical protein